MTRPSKKARRQLLILGDSDLFERAAAAGIAGCDLFLASVLDDAQGVLAAHPDLCLLLVSTPPSLAGCLRSLRARHPQVRAVVLTADAALARETRGLELGDLIRLLAADSSLVELREAIAGAFEQIERAAERHAMPPLPPMPGPGGVRDATAPWLAVPANGIDLRKDWMQVVTHDLRTPLGLQHGSTGLLLGEEYGLDPAARELVERIRAGGEWMLNLVDGMLDIAAIREGRARLASEPTHLRTLLDGVVERLRGLATPLGVRLERTRSRDAQAYGLDRARIEQVLHNLVSNAVRASPPGSVVRIGVRSSKGKLCFSVRDQGRGMSHEQAAHVFVKFSSQDGGRGLGLAICKAIVELHGGHIWVESEPGHGTQFSFTVVPQAIARQARRGSAARRQRTPAPHRK